MLGQVVTGRFHGAVKTGFGGLAPGFSLPRIFVGEHPIAHQGKWQQIQNVIEVAHIGARNQNGGHFALRWYEPGPVLVALGVVLTDKGDFLNTIRQMELVGVAGLEEGGFECSQGGGFFSDFGSGPGKKQFAFGELDQRFGESLNEL